jgi:hypothetical protein
MPPKQQKLSFQGGSSSSEKRPGNPSPDAGKDFDALLVSFMTNKRTMNNDTLDTVRTGLANKYEMFLDVLQQQNDTIAKLQAQLDDQVARQTTSTPTIPIVEAVKPLVQPHPQQTTATSHAKAQQKPRGKATPTPTSAPVTPSTATSAKVMAHRGFTTIVNKKQNNKKTTLLPPPQPTANRKLIFQRASAPTIPTPVAATNAIRIVNKAIVENPDITHLPCPMAHITNSNALVVVVAESYVAAVYNPYLGILQKALQTNGFPIAGARISERWSRFVLSAVPTEALPEQVQTEIESLYPNIRLGQTPRWLTTPKQRNGR